MHRCTHYKPIHVGQGEETRDDDHWMCLYEPVAEEAFKVGNFATRRALVERYDAVKFGIFQRNLSNFRGLVLFCIEADFCNQILIF